MRVKKSKKERKREIINNKRGEKGKFGIKPDKKSIRRKKELKLDLIWCIIVFSGAFLKV